MIIYVVELENSHLAVKSKKLRLVESYIVERKLIGHITEVYKRKGHSTEMWDDNYLIEFEGYAMTNREMEFINSMMLDIDIYIKNLKILQKEGKQNLTNKEKKSIKRIIKQLERGGVRNDHISYCIGDILDHPVLVDEYMTNLEMFRMLVEED